MTQLPNPNDPSNPPVWLPYAQSYAPPKLRPRSVTVLAILGIILGSLVLLGTLCNTFQVFGASLEPSDPVTKGIRDDPVLFVWSIIGVIVNLVLGVLLLGGSIKALSLKRSGRLWMIAYSWLDIGFTLISTAISVVAVMPRISQIVQNSKMNATMQTAVQISVWGEILFSLLLLVFPALILYYMSRPLVKEAFRRGMVAPTPQWDVGAPPQGGGYPPPPGGVP
jgi:hypothetical protein